MYAAGRGRERGKERMEKERMEKEKMDKKKEKEKEKGTAMVVA